MAKRGPWSERSGAERRRTFGGFALLYASIALIALVLGWMLIGVLFALGALGLMAGWYTSDATEREPEPDHEKPAWMLAMDDPDAPDLSLPEYRTRATGPDVADPASPFQRPSDPPVDETTDVPPPPEVPPPPVG